MEQKIQAEAITPNIFMLANEERSKDVVGAAVNEVIDIMARLNFTQKEGKWFLEVVGSFLECQFISQTSKGSL